MKYFLDIKLIPNDETPLNFLMSTFYSQLHRELVNLEYSKIGISFPKYSNQEGVTPSLGGRVRFHSDYQELLITLKSAAFLKRFRELLQMGEVSLAPAGSKWISVRRVQPRSSSERLKRRFKKRFPEMKKEEIESRFSHFSEQRTDLPFLRVNSGSTKQQFLFFIKQEEVGASSQGEFNAYGFSSSATLPYF